MLFGILGDGFIAGRHKAVIHNLGYEYKIYDPVKYERSPNGTHYNSWHEFTKNKFDYYVICTPTWTHYDQLVTILGGFPHAHIICEKPLCLPWEPFIDDNYISIVLQYRYAALPKKGDAVYIRGVRNSTYFRSQWLGDPKLSGGLFYTFFIHYIDLAISHGAEFIGRIEKYGKQERWFDSVDLLAMDQEKLYEEMYKQILAGRIHPKDVAHLNWLLGRYTERFGSGEDLIGKEVHIKDWSLV